MSAARPIPTWLRQRDLSRLAPWRAPVALAVLLLGIGLAWRVPMMLWDHLDLVPIYEAWRAGDLRLGQLLEVHHGSHFHATAYAVLLLTTSLSSGDPWLDCLLSWGFLLVFAFVVLKQAQQDMGEGASKQWYALALLALYPGHLANLQWGWQIAVFVCLASAALCLRALTRETLGPRQNGMALVCAIVASLSFSTGLALFPVACALIVLRQPSSRRLLWLLLPWTIAAAGVAHLLSRGGGTGIPDPAMAVLYVLNFIGGGVARYATGVAPWIAAAAIAYGVGLGWRMRGQREAWFWIGWMLFALGAAGLTALGRASAFGADHAFVTRYVSFSSTFWLGWFGLIFLAARRDGLFRHSRWVKRAAVFVFALSALNGMHLAKKAYVVGVKATGTSDAIRASWPDVDDALLREIYFERSDDARRRLEALHARRYAPFDTL